MGNFFYYGQQDTIRRLNELAGRGAVVASYAPAVGMSPLGGPNGYMTPAWLDPSIPITTTFPVTVGITSKYGYAYLGQNPPTGLWYRIATFAADGSSNAQHLRIDGVLNDGWAANASSPFVLMLGVRGGFYYDSTFNGAVPINARIQVFQLVNGAFEVYLNFRASTFGAASFSLLGYNATTYAQPASVTAMPAGTLVYDSGNAAVYPPRIRGISSAGLYSGTQNAVQINNGLFIGDWTAGGSYILNCPVGAPAGTVNSVFASGIGGLVGMYSAGSFSWYVSGGNGALAGKEGYRYILRAYDKNSGTTSADIARFSGSGLVYLQLLKAGSADVSARHNISRGAAQGDEILYVGRDGATNPSIAVLAADGAGGWNGASSVFYVGKNSVSGRSVAAAGTVSTSGNDYAEYILKSSACGVVAPGQIVGITSGNEITDKWADAVMFSIKSTAPSFVGGDSWAVDVGPRPSPKAGTAPTQPLRREDVVAQQPVPGTNPPEYEDVVTEPGDSDDAWAEKQAAFAAALAAHELAVLRDAEAMAAFDAALEVERQKVDRIAIAGRVPVNVLGAQPGDYIVPVQDGAGIKGIPIRKADLTHSQYLDAVGRVISIEPDGRAYVMVKVV
ncbi:hypothetical protein [Janthinobacterium sp. NKUCC08_JDC]|uniref:hypothetical protein n=1 Tax=Janthinobacterium sp. NKUCC08_JDC TaxID=2842122 RepID=UPI001C5BDFA3|nr:hypothetical protein [Janthinobacterium sp. NKUCC08_JDC]MBW3498885.1 hypothetical protein [Janthinobacterium sp. NKUCC08_JDC]